MAGWISARTNDEEVRLLMTDESPDLPDWSFDGSSTQQADGSSSDCILRPVNEYQDLETPTVWLCVKFYHQIGLHIHQIHGAPALIL